MPAGVKDGPQAAAHLTVLDGFRGIAILLVVLTHSSGTGYHPAIGLGPLTLSIDVLQDGGALGVPLFFFLSGFVLFYPYAKARDAAKPMPGIFHYIDRRFIKIFPSFALAVLVISAIFTVDPILEADRFRQILTHLTFTFPFSKDTMYGVAGTFWSIGVEVEFYVVFPLIAFAMRRRPIATYIAIAIVANLQRGYLHVTNIMGDSYYDNKLLPNIDVFVIGMLCAHLFVHYRERASLPRARAVATGVALVSGIGTFALLADFARATRNNPPAWSHSWLNDHMFLFSLAVATLVLGTLFAQSWWQRIFTASPLVWCSTISYNWYLWHISILTQCARTGFPCAGALSPWTAVEHWNRQYFFSYFAVSITIAVVVTYGFERPLLALGTRGAFDRWIAPLFAKFKLHRAAKPFAALTRENP